MSSRRLALMLFLLPLPLLAGPPRGEVFQEEQPGSDAGPPVPVVKLAAQASGPAPRALRYNLLPQRSDLVPGNAASSWIRAGQAARDIAKKPNDKWGRASDTPLKDLPKKEVRAALEPFAAALRIAEQASRRERCDWELPPLTFENWDFPLTEIQGCRELAQLLSIRFRLELSEGNFYMAARTLQTGFALARHIGESDTLIQGLVGLAIGAVMFGLVEEWMQVPGSPNLYWSLSALPVPFIDVRRAMEFELSNLDRTLPELAQFRKRITEPLQVQAMVVKLTAMTANLSGQNTPAWQAQLAMATLAAKYYPDARRYLRDNGYTAEHLDAMSPVQVVIVFHVEQYDHYRDEVVKWLSLPPWQALPGIAGVMKGIGRLHQEVANPFIRLLFPAVEKVYESRARTERIVAVLRCAEALRMHAAAHEGNAPDKLADVTAVPLPVDPYTGKGFEGLYTAKDGRGVLEIPSMNPRVPQLGRRIEVGAGR